MQQSIWPVIAAATATTILGYLWYHPSVFGKSWIRYNGVTPEMAERGARRIHIYTALGFVAFLIVAYVLRALLISLRVDLVPDAIRVSIYVWIGFIAPVLAGSVLWEHRPLLLYIINAGYWLVALILMSALLYI